MASVYILYSKTADRYYIGSTKDIEVRIGYHKQKEFRNSFTAKYEDWVLFLSIDNISMASARKIEAQIKRMKSRVYIENLKKYPDMVEKLVEKYRTN